MSTMKDVAKKAGVSVATVSYAINGTKALSPETLAKVRAAIKELKYSPDQTAKVLKRAGNISLHLSSRIFRTTTFPILLIHWNRNFGIPVIP